MRPSKSARDEGIDKIEEAIAVLRTKTQNFEDSYDIHKDEILNYSFQMQYVSLERLKAIEENLQRQGNKQEEIFQLIKSFQTAGSGLFDLLRDVAGAGQYLTQGMIEWNSNS